MSEATTKKAESADQTAKFPQFRNWGPRHEDLRDWLDRCEEIGELLRLDNIHWDEEMGAITEMVYHKKPDNPPTILFENIPGYPKGYKALSGMVNSPRRLALTLGFDEPETVLDVVRSYRNRMKGFELIPPVEVSRDDLENAPIFENVDRDDEVDLYKFPAPFFHEEDGGRYIGTAVLVMMKDPDSDWVNHGTYRAQLHDKNTVGMWASPGKHGSQIKEKWFAQGKDCPVLMSIGHDPLLHISSGNEVGPGISEFDYAGGHRGKPFEICKSELHGLPIPARGEICPEGEILLNEKRDEGPFGEWTGYYASAVRADHPVRIRRVYYRSNPILTTARPGRPPSDYSLAKCVVKAAMIWDQVEKAGLPNVRGVWCMEFGGGRLFNVISIKQSYAGHAKQALLLAAGAHGGNYIGRFVVVVDDDIHPGDLWSVMWAISSRCDPVDDIDIIRNAWSGPLDPRKQAGDNYNSRALIDACRPFHWKDEFPHVAESTPELKKKTLEKFGWILDQI